MALWGLWALGGVKAGFSHHGRRDLGSSLLPFPVCVVKVRLESVWLLEMGWGRL